MNRKEMLEKTIETVTKHRVQTHGQPEASLNGIATLWSAYLDKPLTGKDVAVLMVLFKAGRIKNNPNHHDNWLDIAGYAACGCEIATTPAEPEKVWHYSHLCKRLCGNDEPNSSGTEIANRVTCPACLEKMLEITKESMGFGKDVTFKEKRTDPLVTVTTSRVRSMLNSEECRSHYGCFFVAGPDGQVIYDVLDVLEAFDDWWPYVGNTTLPHPENIGKDCFIYRELNFKEAHVRMLCNIYKKWKEAGKCA